MRYRKDGKPASHVPDLLVWRAGTPELCDVKSAERLEDPEFLAQVAATGLACAEAGFGYRVLSEPDRQLLVNVRWLAGFRERPADPDGERARMLSVLAAGPCTIGELLSGAREPVLARPVLMHLLWAGEALADLSEPIGEESRRVGAAAGGGMIEPRWPLGVGGRLVIDGEMITVSSVDGAEVRGFTARGEQVRFVLTRVAEEPAARERGVAVRRRCCSTPAR